MTEAGAERWAEPPIPLSSAQQRLWFTHQLSPDSGLYNLSIAVDLVGEVDPVALRDALRWVVARHEGLRTRFPDTGGIPRQEVLAGFDPELPCVELTGRAEMERAAFAHAGRAFDLAAEVPLRALLLRWAPDRWRLMLTCHHVLIDGWSVETVLRELAARYRDRDAVLGPVACHYPDYSRWQRELLDGPEGDRLVAFWRDRLAGARPPALPADRPAPRRRSFAGDTVEAEVPAAVTARVAALAGPMPATPYMVHLAVFATQLARWSGIEDVVVGVPMACRTEPEHEDVVGCTVNVVPLRLGVAPDASFRETLTQVRDRLLDAFVHQQLPLDRIADLVGGRGRDRTPLLRVVCSHMGPAPELDLGTTACRVVQRFPTGSAKFDLTLTLVEDATGVRVAVEYATELFGPATVRGFLDRYLAALDSATADPDRPLPRLRKDSVA